MIAPKGHCPIGSIQKEYCSAVHSTALNTTSEHSVHYSALYCTPRHFRALCAIQYTLLHSTSTSKSALYCTQLPSTVIQCTLYCTPRHFRALYCTQRHFRALCVIQCTLYCTPRHFRALFALVHSTALRDTSGHSIAQLPITLCTTVHSTALHDTSEHSVQYSTLYTLHKLQCTPRRTPCTPDVACSV